MKTGHRLFVPLFSALLLSSLPATGADHPDRGPDGEETLLDAFLTAPDCGSGLGTLAEQENALRPFLYADQQAFIDRVISDDFFHRCAWDRTDALPNASDVACAQSCDFILDFAFEANRDFAAQRLRQRAKEQTKHPTAWARLYRYDRRISWPPDLLALVFDASLPNCVGSLYPHCFDLLCEGIARRSWTEAETRVARLGETRLGPHDDLGFIDACIVHHSSSGEGIPQYPGVARYLVRKALRAVDPVASPAFATYLDVATGVPEALPLILAATDRWIAGHFTCADADPVACGEALARQLDRFATPEAKAARSRLTPVLAGQTRRRSIRFAGRRAVDTVPLLLLSGLGVAQVLSWRQPDHPASARTSLATVNTAILGTAATTALALALVAPPGSPGGGSFSGAMNGLGEALILIGTGLTVGTVALVGTGYLGYRLRENRTFYMGVALTQTTLPLLLGVLHIMDLW